MTEGTKTLIAIAALAALLAAAPVPALALTGEYEGSVRLSLESLELSLDESAPLSQAAAEGSEADASIASPPDDTKNPMLAFLMSAVLPGWGQLYTGHTTKAKVFLGVEAAIWLGYASYTVQGNMRRDDYEEYASIFAGVGDNMSSSYYQDIADFIRSEGDASYNQDIRAEARSLFPGDLDAQRAYLAANGYFDELAWEWQSEVRFDHYRELRRLEQQSERNAFYMTGLAVLNRAVSSIDAAWMARRYNERAAGGPDARLSVVPEFSEGTVGARATLEISF
jgi:hypothetical protein